MTDQDGKLAEYESLRKEILQNDKMIQCMTLVALFAVTAPLILFAFKEHSELLMFPPLAFFVYLQMVIHKLEGTTRIASYISVFLESEIPGLSWESRLAKIKGKVSGTFGIVPHVVLMLMATIGSLIPSITASNGPHAYASGGIAVIVLILSMFQLSVLNNFNGADKYAKAWKTLKE